MPTPAHPRPAQSAPPRTPTLQPSPQNCVLGHILLLLNLGGGCAWPGSSFCSSCALVAGAFAPPKTLGASKNSQVSPKEKDPREAARPEASPPSRSLECSRRSPAWGRGGVGAAGLRRSPALSQALTRPGRLRAQTRGARGWERGPARGAPSHGGRSPNRRSWPRPGEGRGAGWGRCPRGCGLALSPGHGQAPTTPPVLAGWRSNG